MPVDEHAPPEELAVYPVDNGISCRFIQALGTEIQLWPVLTRTFLPFTPIALSGRGTPFNGYWQVPERLYWSLP